ncbi:protein-tyrosine phosphatase-like protein, partial [Irpex lacteus]
EGRGREEETEPAGRYLNASWVRELAGKKWWIATQAPLPDTMHAFLSLIFQPLTRPLDLNPRHNPGSEPTSRIRTVVQLTRVRESGTQKAHFYFPQRPGESWITPPEPGCHAPPLKVTLLESKVVEEAGCVHSLVSIQPLTSGEGEDEGERVVFNHMFYEGWPDHDVPSDPHSLLRFALLVDKISWTPDPPIVVGCSAGIGRTGTFIALSSLLRAHRFLPPTNSLLHEKIEREEGIGESPLGELPEEFREDEVVREAGMVQKLGQMKMVYELLVGVLLAGTEPVGEYKDDGTKAEGTAGETS